MLTRLCALLLTVAAVGRPPAGVLPSHSPQPDTICIVSQVSDGDSFRCGDGRRVRLIGIDSPELGQEPSGAEARDALAALIPPGTTVRLEHDAAVTDRYGRGLAYAWLGCTMINEAMVQRGWAVLYTVPPNVKYADRLTRVQKEARARGAGLWSRNGFACLPNDFRRGVCVSPP